MTSPDDELRAAIAEVDELTSRLAADRTLGIAVGIVAERLKLSDTDAERALHTLAADEGRDVGEVAGDLVRARREPR